MRLCGGDREQAWDLTQDSWVTVVDRLAQGQTDKATVGFLLSVARSRYLDAWRRQRRLQRKLRLVWAAARESETPEVSAAKVLEHLSVCSDEHRVVLMLAYVDGMPVAESLSCWGRPSHPRTRCSRGTQRAAHPPHRRPDMTNTTMS